MFRATVASRASGLRRYSARGTSIAGRHLPTFEPLEDRALLTATYLPPQHSLLNYDGYLSGPSDDAPVAIAESYLRANAADLGILPADIDDYIITTNYTTATTGATTLTFQQSLHGLPVLNANYNITVADDGRILYVGGGFVPELSARAQQPRPAPALAAIESLSSTADALGLTLTDPPIVVGHPNDGVSTFRAPSLSLDDISTSLHYVAVPDNDIALSWNLTVRTPDSPHWYNVSIDAGGGELLSLIDYAHDATYEVFALPNEDPDEGARTVETDPDIISPTPATVPSPFGWHDTDGAPGAELTITSGNNVNAYADRDADNAPDAGSQPDGGAALDFTGDLVPLDLGQEPDTYTAAAVVNLFYWNNILHDVHYLYGFDEAARNFQVNNYGRGGAGNDAVNAEAQDGSGTDNANFATPPDGTPPRMQMFEFTFTTPRRDSDFDNEIIIHEYGHGVSNRLTGNGTGLFALQSGGMGEGWSDWWSLMLTQVSATETIDGRGVGTYVLGQPQDGPGIRDFPYDFDIADPDLETFLHYGSGPGQSTQVHSAGTRWSAALWDINHLFIEKYGFEPNIYDSTSTAGNIRALHLVMNALKIQALNPTFIQARDAILMADELLYDGANQLEIWTAFARRGLGEFASTPSSESEVLTTSFEIPERLLTQFSVGPDLALLEGDGGTTPFVFLVSVDREVEDPITVAFETADGTAIAGIDYTAQSGTLTFEAGPAISIPVTIEVTGDLTVEPNETFFLRLTDVSSGGITDGEAVGTILNDDVDLAINDVAVTEGHSGATNAIFTVSAVGAVNRTVTVSYTTLDNSATAATDYLPRAGTLSFPPGTSSAQVIVPVLGDALEEGDHSFFVFLHSATGARIVDERGTAAIRDDDRLPAFYVSDAQVTTNAGVRSALFTVALDGPSGRPVSVGYSTADGAAVAGVDYAAQSGQLTFQPGVTSIPVSVPIMATAQFSPNRTFFLNLSSPQHATMADGHGVGTMTLANNPVGQIIVDDGDAAYSQSRSGWTNVTNTLAYELDYSYHAAGNGGAAATWTFAGLPSGSYEVFTRWTPFGNRATNAPYTVLDRGTPLGTVEVNQQLAPVGETSDGVTWQSLGTFEINTNTLAVRLTDAANGFVVADAVRIVSDALIQDEPPQAGPAHNAAMPQDVNNDGRVSVNDALIIINDILTERLAPAAAPAAATMVTAAAADAESARTFYVDVNADGRVTPSDLLMVVNYLLQPPPAAPSAASDPSLTAPLAAVAVDEAIRHLDARPATAVVSSPLSVVADEADDDHRSTASDATLLTPARVAASLVDEDPQSDAEASVISDIELAFLGDVTR